MKGNELCPSFVHIFHQVFVRQLRGWSKDGLFFGEQRGHLSGELYREKSWHSGLSVVSCQQFLACTGSALYTISALYTVSALLDGSVHTLVHRLPATPATRNGRAAFRRIAQKTVKSIKRHGSATSVFSQAHLGNISCFIARWQHCLRYS